MADRFRLRSSWGMVVWLTGVWVLLWGDITLANVVAGLVVAVVVTTLAPLPRTRVEGRLRPWGVVRLVVRFARDVVLASVQVAAVVLSGRQPQGAVIRVRMRSHSDVFLSLLAGMTSLVPGSVVVEAHRFTATLYIHVFDVALQGGLERARATVLAQEERILQAFASDDTLREAGLKVPASRWPRRTTAGRTGQGER